MGVTTTNIDPAPLLDEIIGNRGGSSVRASIDAVAAQIVNSAPLASAIAGKADAATVAALEAQITTNGIVQPTWAALAALTGDLAGHGAEVIDDDTGTHTDPVVGGTAPNSGRYSWSVSPAGWRRIGATGLSGKASQTQVNALQSTTDRIATAMDEVEASLGARAATASTGLSDDGAYGAMIKPGDDVAVGAVITAIEIPMVRVAAGATKIHLVLLSRGTSYSETAVPGAGTVADVVLAEQTLALATVGLTAGAAGATMRWDLPSPVLVGTDWLIWTFEALDAADARQVSGSGYRTAATESAGQRGWYRTTVSSGWGPINASIALGWHLIGTEAVLRAEALPTETQAQLALIASKADVADLDATKLRVTGLEEAFSAEPVSIMSRPSTAGFGLSNDTSWAALIKPAEVTDLRAVHELVIPHVRVGATTTQIRLRLWTRASTSTEDAAPGQAYDTLIMDRIWAPEDLGIALTVTNTEVVFPLDEPYQIGSDWLLWRWDSMDASDAATISGSGYLSAGSYSDAQRGWYRTDYLGSTSLGHINAAYALACGLRGQRSVLSAHAMPAAEAAAPVTRDLITAAEITATGLSVSAAVTLRRQSDDFVISGSVACGAPSSGSVAAEARTLVYGNGSASFAYVDALGKLAHAGVSAVVVRRTSDSAVLLAGSDYLLNARWGAIALPSAVADVPVTVDYDWTAARYDLLYLDAVTLTLGVVAGTEGARGEVLDAAAAPGGSSRIPLAYLRVTASAVEVLPVWQVDGIVHADLAEQWARDHARNRRVLRKTLGALRDGDTVVVAPYGDSIVAMQNAVPATTTPNGTARDRATSAGGYIPAILLPLYDFGDGAGAVHTKLGVHWDIARAMEEGWGATVEMQNWGIGGTRSSSAEPGGLWPARINAYIAALTAAVGAGKGALAIIHFGMNEIGIAATESQVTEILRQVYATGADALVVGVARRNVVDVGYTDAQWRLTNRALRRAAEYVDPTTGKSAAYLDTMALFDDAANVLGISRLDNCATNGTNHPRLRELAAIGQAAVMWLE